MRPLVSVVMPVYNVEQYVAGAIYSVLDQTYPEFEILIVDDGGDDASVDICSLFSDPRIRIINQANRGLAGARNTGIRHARGKYVAFLDPDDLWNEQKLSAHIAHLERDPGIGVSYSPSILVDDSGAEIGIVQQPMLLDVQAHHVFLRNPVGNGSAPVIRRTTLDDITFFNDANEPCWFDERFRQSEDIECWMRIALNTHWKFEGVREALTYYRINEGGLSANITKQLESWKLMCSIVKSQHPEFFARWGRLSEAFQLRYLARRAARMRFGRIALHLTIRAIVCDIKMSFREPMKTMTTLGAACALCLLPRAVYEGLERSALRGLRSQSKGVTA